MNQCSATRTDGSPCPAPAGEDGFCVFHRPMDPVIRREFKSQGGRRWHEWITEAGEVGLTVEDILSLIQETVSNLRSMPQQPQTANSMLQASRLLLDCYEVATLGSRADQIEAMLTHMKVDHG